MTTIRFLLNGELTELGGVDPSRTVLQTLREELHLCGTKEGCAEGDCGACTVVVAEPRDGKLHYQAMNACIQFLPTIHGKALFTVEHLKHDGKLHPVQQSLVDHHASQCGFCTPGFVMSMFARYQQQAPADLEEIEDVLSGNLCRCTGYRPIIEACQRMYDYPPVVEDEHKLLQQLEALQDKEPVELTTESHRYTAPTTLQSLAETYQQRPTATLLAGGTDVGLWVTKQLRYLPDVIYLGAVDELNQITSTNAVLEIGATVSLERGCAAIVSHYPELQQFLRRFASLPVRNAGTLVGNIANGSPIGDSMPALIALGSTLILRQGEQQREIPMEDLYLDYMKKSLREGEFVEAVRIPIDSEVVVAGYKLSKRFDQDISAVCGAFALRLDGDQVTDIRIAYGGMAAIPKRADETERCLIGQSWEENSIRAAMAALESDFQPLSDMRSSANYRGRAAANLLYRFYLQTRLQNPLPKAQLDVFEPREVRL